MCSLIYLLKQYQIYTYPYLVRKLSSFFRHVLVRGKLFVDFDINFAHCNPILFTLSVYSRKPFV